MDSLWARIADYTNLNVPAEAEGGWTRMLLRRNGDRFQATGDGTGYSGQLLIETDQQGLSDPMYSWPPIPVRVFAREDSPPIFELCEGTLSFDVPISVADDGETHQAIITVSVDLAAAVAALRLRVGNEVVESAPSPHLEFAVPDVQQRLGMDRMLLCCFNCAMSDYSHAGNGLDGMLCFRASRAEYLAVRDKRDYIRLVPDRVTQVVDELYACPQFERRVPGTGYRG